MGIGIGIPGIPVPTPGEFPGEQPLGTDPFSISGPFGEPFALGLQEFFGSGLGFDASSFTNFSIEQEIEQEREAESQIEFPGNPTAEEVESGTGQEEPGLFPDFPISFGGLGDLFDFIFGNPDPVIRELPPIELDPVFIPQPEPEVVTPLPGEPDFELPDPEGEEGERPGPPPPDQDCFRFLKIALDLTLNRGQSTLLYQRILQRIFGLIPGGQALPPGLQVLGPRAEVPAGQGPTLPGSGCGPLFLPVNSCRCCCPPVSCCGGSCGCGGGCS